MSMPSFPACGLDISEEQALNMLLGSIAMEELALSHIMNAEGEKLQYFLGTLPGSPKPCVTAQEILAINRSISNLLEQVSNNQLLLKGKLSQVLEAKERHSAPTPPLTRTHRQACVLQGSAGDFWCRGEPILWQKGCAKECMFSALRLPCAPSFLLDFHFELCAFEAGLIRLSLQGTPWRGLPEGLSYTAFSPFAESLVQISGSLVLSADTSPASTQVLRFFLSQPNRVLLRSAQLSVTAL